MWGKWGQYPGCTVKLNATPSPGESQPISQTPNRITDVPLGARLAHFEVHLWSLGLTDCRSKRHCLESGYHRAKDPTKKNHHLHSIWTIKRERPVGAKGKGKEHGAWG